MSSDHLAEIQAAIRAVLEGEPGTCATLSVQGHPKLWLQIADDTVNAAYPQETEPVEMLRRLPSVDGLALSEWEPQRFFTVRLEDLANDELPGWIDAYFVTVFDMQAGVYQLDLRLEEL